MGNGEQSKAEDNLHAENVKRLLPISLTQGMGLACGVAGISIASRLVSPEAYGAYGVFLTLTPLGMSVVHAGLVKYVARHWAGADDRSRLLREVMRAMLRKLPLLAVVTLGAVWVAPGLLAGGAAWWSTWLFLFAGASLMSAAWIGQTALQAGREHWRDCGVSAAGSVTRSFVPPLLYAVSGGLAAALQGGFVVHALVLAVAARRAAGKAARSADHGQDARATRSHGRVAHATQTTWAGRPCHPILTGWQPVPLDPHGRVAHATRAGERFELGVYGGALFVVLAVAAWGLTAVNRWIVAGFFGNEAAGFFTLAGNISVIVTSMLGIVFVQYWQPVIFAMPSASREERKALAARVDIVALAYTLCGVAGVGFLHEVAPWLVGTVIGEKYAGALGWIAAAGCFGVAVVTGQFFHMLLLAGRKERDCAVVDLSGAAVLVAGGVIAAVVGGACGGSDASGGSAGEGARWFWWWLVVSPAVPWVLQRTLARRALMKGA